MLGPSKYYLFVYSASIIIASLSFHSARGGEPEKKSIINNETVISGQPVQSAMNVAVLDNNGNVIYTDVVTPTDPHLNYNLETLPIGEYRVEVKQGDEVINTTELSNVSSNSNVITVEVLNEAGELVFKSAESKEMFDLEKMPKGKYVVNVYQAENLINTNTLKQ